MKRALALLFILGSAAVILSAVDLSRSDSVTITGSARPVTGGFGIDTKNIEARIAELRSDSESYSNSMEDEDGEFINTGNVKALSPGSRLERSLSVNLLSNNSTGKDSLPSGSISQNGTANTTALNASAANASALAPTAIKGSEVPSSSNLGSEDASSSSPAAAKSFYNTSTSRQGMGNSAIKSSMSLKGDFEVKKSAGF